MTLCTIDVHARDVVAKLVQLRVESASAFQWQSQLRHRCAKMRLYFFMSQKVLKNDDIPNRIHSRKSFCVFLYQINFRWDENVQDCFINICDAQFKYLHEYLGNTPRLVITPLTDRCYITLTQVKLNIGNTIVDVIFPKIFC